MQRWPASNPKCARGAACSSSSLVRGRPPHARHRDLGYRGTMITEREATVHGRPGSPGPRLRPVRDRVRGGHPGACHDATASNLYHNPTALRGQAPDAGSHRPLDRPVRDHRPGRDRPNAASVRFGLMDESGKLERQRDREPGAGGGPAAEPAMNLPDDGR